MFLFLEAEFRKEQRDIMPRFALLGEKQIQKVSWRCNVLFDMKEGHE